jgi:hypothetical protein
MPSMFSAPGKKLRNVSLQGKSSYSMWKKNKENRVPDM